MSEKTANPAAMRLDKAIEPVGARLNRAGVLSVAASLCWLPQAALVAWLFSDLLTGAGSLTASVQAAVGFAFLGVLRAGLQLRSDELLADASDLVLAREREALVIREGRRSPMADGPGSAEVAALAGEKLALLSPYITRYRPAQLRVGVVPLAILCVALVQSWVVAVILLIAGPLIPVFMALVGMAAQEASERQMDEIGSLNSLLMERLQALVDVRLLDARERVTAQFADRADALRDRTMAVLRVAFLSSTVLELFSALGVALVAVYVGFALLGTITFGAWATPLTAGEGVFLLLLAPEFFQPLRDLAAAWHDKAAAAAVARDLLAAENTEPIDMLGQGGVPSGFIAGSGAPSIAVRDLRVALRAGAEIGFPDFEIAPGESCALVGPSGRGKSMLLAALAGLVPVSKGRITLDDRPLDDGLADAWRMRVGWVPQTPHFFSTSLKANLRLASPEATESEMSQALRFADADQVVARLPRGLLARLGETGSGVSGGEARRLTVARAALGRPSVILADEPTANLDAETGKAVTDGLLDLAAQGATLVVATHDAALAARMDRRIDLGGMP